MKLKQKISGILTLLCALLGYLLCAFLLSIFGDYYWWNEYIYFYKVIPIIIAVSFIQIGAISLLIYWRSKEMIFLRKFIATALAFLSLFIILPSILFWKFGFILIGFTILIYSIVGALKTNVFIAYNPCRHIITSIISIFLGIVILRFEFMPTFSICGHLFYYGGPLNINDFLVKTGILLIICANLIHLIFDKQHFLNNVWISITIMGLFSLFYSAVLFMQFASARKEFLTLKVKTYSEYDSKFDFGLIEQKLLWNLKFHPYSYWSADAWYTLGEIYELRGDKQMAIMAYQNSLYKLKMYKQNSYSAKLIYLKINKLEKN
jgi:hypothetical protein